MSESKPSKCVFCEIKESRVVKTNDLAFAVFDMYPVSNGHTLIIPFRHVSSFFELNMQEITSINYLLHVIKIDLDNQYSPDGFNIGINIGSAAGQTIEHVHIHLIPRYIGDVTDPFGGVRNTIPGKGRYISSE